MSPETIRTTKKMLKVLASSTPQTPNMSELYRELDTERNQGLKMLGALDRAGLLALAPGKGQKLGTLSRPEKIFCDNTNLMYALVPQIDNGTKRETYRRGSMMLLVCFGIIASKGRRRSLTIGDGEARPMAAQCLVLGARRRGVNCGIIVGEGRNNHQSAVRCYCFHPSSVVIGRKMILRI